MTTSHTGFELISVIRTFFSYSQKPKDTIHAVVQLSTKRHMKDSSLCSLKWLQPKQVGQDGSCLFVINQNLVFFCSQSGNSGSKTV